MNKIPKRVLEILIEFLSIFINKMKSTTFKENNPDGFMVEHLTPLRGKVAYLLRKDSNIAKSWSIDGRLKVFKTGYTQSDKPVNISSLNDLTQLGWSQDRIDNLILKK